MRCGSRHRVPLSWPPPPSLFIVALFPILCPAGVCVALRTWPQSFVRHSLTTTASTRTTPQQRSRSQRQLQRRLPRLLPLMTQLTQRALPRPRDRQAVRVQPRTSRQLQTRPRPAKIRQHRTGAGTPSAALTHATCCQVCHSLFHHSTAEHTVFTPIRDGGCRSAASADPNDPASQPPHGSDVFIGGIPKELTDEQLREFASPAGEVRTRLPALRTRR